MYFIGIAATVLTLVGLEVLGRVFKSVGLKSSEISFTTDNKDTLKTISDLFHSKDYLIVSYHLDKQRISENDFSYKVSMIIKSKKYNDEGQLFKMLQDYPDVTIERIE
jgi:putative Mg2+ transporter-C (MgtC) family protein